MQGRKVVRELYFDPEIEKTARVNKKAARLAREAARSANIANNISEEEVSSPKHSDNKLNIHIMAADPPPPLRTLGDYDQRNNGELANLGFQPRNPVSFEIKNYVLSALKEDQFSGSESQKFYEACDYTDPPGVSESAKRLRLFKYSLIGRAKDWLDTIPPNTINTWQELEVKLLERYFPIHKYHERRQDITSFEQGDSETLYDAWERFKLSLKKCPKHGIDSHAQMQHFTQGLGPQTRMFLDASTGGSLKNKNENEARELLENMSQNEYRVQNDRGAKKKGGMLELDTQTALLAQSTLMNSQMAAMLKHFTNSSNSQMQVRAAQDLKCDFCGQGHVNGECFPEGSSQSQQQSSSQSSQQRKPSQLEDTLSQFIKVTQGNFEAMKISQDQLKANQDIANKNHEASIKNLENQMGQLSRQFSATQNNGFEGSTKDNPRNETCKAINLRSRVVPSPEVEMKKKKALEQMPIYAKFMKELLTKKRKPLDDETIDMTEECSAIIQKKLP
ncbi:uncharacterized protein LOC123914922 [Trifolium pratense]|uniref:uncharacterized protein LOC123914922 n=1 Tax=Trifolium pratense TaxID=57577 RepID=UPI001E692036|nr:uncharacterized protein LOC123914922 [Trifolium pratense]